MKMNRVLKLFANNRVWNFFLTKFFLPNILKLIEQEPKNALEIGCGAGFTTKELLNRFPRMRLTAIDIDSEQVKKAKRNLNTEDKSRFQVLMADAAKLPFTPESFDTVFVFDTLHHIANFEESIKEISRVLKNGGCLYIMDVGKEFFNPIFRWIDQPEALFTLEEIKNAAQKFNFKIKKQLDGKKIFYLVFEKHYD